MYFTLSGQDSYIEWFMIDAKDEWPMPDITLDSQLQLLHWMAYGLFYNMRSTYVSWDAS